MSRLYDALRHAARTQPGADHAADETDWNVFGGRVRVSPATLPAEDLLAAAERAGAVIAESEEKAGAPTAAPDGIATPVNFDRRARVIPNGVQAEVIEQYRRLRTKLLKQKEASPFHSLLVTSANPQEGKSVTTVNLALSFSMLQGFRVVVVDGDLRKGSLGRWLGQTEQPGLSNVVDGSATLADIVLKSDSGPLYFVTRGTSSTAPADLLQSPTLGRSLRQLSKHFDLVLVDSPPVNILADAHLLAANCDAVLLVARAFSTTRKALERAVQELSSNRIVGSVLNGGTQANRYTKYHGYY